MKVQAVLRVTWTVPDGIQDRLDAYGATLNQDVLASEHEYVSEDSDYLMSLLADEDTTVEVVEMGQIQ